MLLEVVHHMQLWLSLIVTLSERKELVDFSVSEQMGKTSFNAHSSFKINPV